MQIPDRKDDAKMDLISYTSELMPKGAPNLVGVIKYPTIERLGQELGKKPVLMMIFTLVRDLCDSFNIVRNMNEDQMLETASMLLDECDNFRLEDYVMMFALAKRGQLVKVYDHLDMDMVGEMMDEYWKRRNEAGRKKQDEDYREFEENLRKIERAPGKYLKPGESIEDGLMGQIKELTQKIILNSEAEDGKEFERRDDRIRRRQQIIYESLTEKERELLKKERELLKKERENHPHTMQKNDSSEKSPENSEKFGKIFIVPKNHSIARNNPGVDLKNNSGIDSSEK